ncbi:hypothetical protein CPJCM30710_06680 [Clostridium polyendosporum]|uniref:Uncharacterized protein n=1 Tax=Clostridium polyendosporum TaxID=69208 RepID=A0A919RWY8_9CLOT|nr:hypothetical protein [Clostridium polyendosporum]GIM28002.1 hypothetical protein CPJCM30710_06680 [Clostridium polyendosporum]
MNNKTRDMILVAPSVKIVPILTKEEFIYSIKIEEKLKGAL